MEYSNYKLHIYNIGIRPKTSPTISMGHISNLIIANIMGTISVAITALLMDEIKNANTHFNNSSEPTHI